MDSGTGDDSCQLLGPISLLIQMLMGIAAISGLLLKRRYEVPKRRWRVWFFDISKQVFGSLIIHFLNLGISILKQRKARFLLLILDDDPGGDQCDWYFLNLLMDTTVGTLILWFVLGLLEDGLQRLGVQNIESGNYYPSRDSTRETEEGTPVRNEPLFSAFGKQLLIYVCGLSIMKFCVFLVLAYFEVLATWFAKLVLGWSDNWPNFQVFLVMFVFPILLNFFQCFCIDNIIKLHPRNFSTSELENFEDGPILYSPGLQNASHTKTGYGST
ncbi:LAQU0S01e05446g1_1 [Lachancea quebecensis]|uniref:LAQU0S01e05446g1_1 n=1 Tax=Lachancea quebecensis TaxID=1654605 RepID=A0A0P1KLB4_9SACH|nr:LAQU0S01e05446g1_1 [Lachancea quebecensis]